MTHVFYLDPTPADEMTLLYLADLARQSQDLRVHGPARLLGLPHTPMPSFDVSQGMASVRSAIYRQRNFKDFSVQAHDTIHLFGYAALFCVPQQMLTSYSTTLYIGSIPNDMPASFKHKVGKLADGINVIAPNQFIGKAVVQWGVEQGLIKQALPKIEVASSLPSPFKGFTAPGFMIGVVCPLEANQGLETVIQAVQLSLDIMPDIKVFIIGDGPDKRRFQWLISQTNLKDRVHIASNSADYQRFLQHVEICIAPAVQDDGCDPIILQARAHGVAVVATETPSHAEFIEHGKSGLLFAPGNSHMLSQHLINLYTHRDWLEHYKKIGPV